MITIRESNYKIINNEILIGVELEAKGENYCKDSNLRVCFYNNGTLVKEDKSWSIPYVVGEGIIYVGNKYKNDLKFDDIKVELVLGEQVYEKTNYDKIEWLFDSTDGKKLVYKFINHSSSEIEFAILNLVFYNKGELVCGDSIKKENLLSERVYYFEYDIPDGLEYTEVLPFFLLPSTNYYLFNDFFKEYSKYNDKIIEIKKEYKDYRQNESFFDETARYNSNVKSAKKRFDENLKKKKKTRNELIFSIIILFIIFAVVKISGLVITWISNLFGANISLFWRYGLLFILLLPFTITYTKRVIKDFIDITNTFIKGRKKIKQAKIELENYKVKSVQDKERITERNERINNNNREIDLYNAKIKEKEEVVRQDFNNFIDKYNEYDMSFASKEDMDILEDAINAGAIFYEEVINYYQNIKNEQERIRILKEQEQKENKRQEEIVAHLKNLEEEFVRSTNILRDQLIQNSYENTQQMQNILNQYAYISQSQSDAQVKAINNLKKEVKKEMKKQTFEMEGIYNDVHHF